MATILQVHAEDDLLVALDDLRSGAVVEHGGKDYRLLDDVPAKHKFVVRDVPRDGLIKMYGVVVARALQPIRAGQLLTTANAVHATDDLQDVAAVGSWQAPDVTDWKDATFDGYMREDGRVGTRNYWLVLPLVFCENHNVRMMRDAMVEELGYAVGGTYRQYMRKLVAIMDRGGKSEEIVHTSIDPIEQSNPQSVFPHIEGIKFLTHDGGCGCGYDEALNLSALLAGYINHPNVAGATLLSLGCQKARIVDLENQLHSLNPNFNKRLLIFDQQQIGSEQTLVSKAIRHTLAGMIEANKARREPVPVGQLVVGLECGGSDGFSGLSANPAIGHCSDLLVALGGTTVLSEFPELSGCEYNLASRCMEPRTAQRFLALMKGFEKYLVADGNRFADNPSPGNIHDGLITDAMKSAGAARKGGTSPVVDVLDYPEPITRSGLNLLCTPGHDVESTTAMAGSGATAMLFSTGLGTPAGNPIAPILKVASNSDLARKMPDIIDYDAGGILSGAESIEQVGTRLLEQVIALASNKRPCKAEMRGQDDFIPWKRSLTF